MQPALGRDFIAADDSPSANGTVMLSWSLWKRRFGGNPAILNQTVYIDAKPYTVIGVMPEWFAFPDPETQLWLPSPIRTPRRIMAAIDNHMFRVVGRLKPGVSEAQAVTDLSLISLRVHDAHLDDACCIHGGQQPSAARSHGRAHQAAAVRAAGGHRLPAADRVPQRRQSAGGPRGGAPQRTRHSYRSRRRPAAPAARTPHGERSCSPASAGSWRTGFAYGALQWLVQARHDMSRVESIHIDGVVAAFTVANRDPLRLVLRPDLRPQRPRLAISAHPSRSIARAQRRPRKTNLRRVLLTLQVGLTVVLLIGAGLLLKSYERLRSTDMGCLTHNVLTLRIGLPDARYTTPADRANFFDTLLERVRVLPGITAAGIVEVRSGPGLLGRH